MDGGDYGRQALPMPNANSGHRQGLIATLGAGGMSLREVRARMEAGEPPASAEEYLLRVRLEADAMPDVISISGSVARGFSSDELPDCSKCATDSTKCENGADSSSMNEGSKTKNVKHIQIINILPDFATCPPELLPDPSWQRRCSSCFSECRQYLHRARAKYHQTVGKRAPSLPPLNDGYGWERLCFGNNIRKDAEQESDQSSDAYPPLLGIILSLDQQGLIRVLSRHVKWICGDELATDGEVSSQRSGRHLSKARASWLYALMAGLEKPLHKDTAALLRQLGRHCANMRATCITSTGDTLLPSVNILLTLITIAFGQG